MDTLFTQFGMGCGRVSGRTLSRVSVEAGAAVASDFTIVKGNNIMSVLAETLETAEAVDETAAEAVTIETLQRDAQFIAAEHAATEDGKKELAALKSGYGLRVFAYLETGGAVDKLAKVSDKGNGVFGESIWKAVNTRVSEAKKVHEYLSAGNALSLEATEETEAVERVSPSDIMQGNVSVQRAYIAINKAKKAAKDAHLAVAESRREAIEKYLQNGNVHPEHANMDVDTFLNTVPLADPLKFGEALVAGQKLLDIEAAEQQAIENAAMLERYARTLIEAGWHVESPEQVAARKKKETKKKK